MPSFFAISKRLENALTSQATVENNEHHLEVVALWDTGATNCCIAKELVEQLHLIPDGITRIHTPSGIASVRQFTINIVLPNGIHVPNVEVTESEIGLQGLGLLIGMDIITLGDFALCNEGQQTSFTFRIPPQERINFVKQETKRNLIGKPHGKGKSKRKK